MLLLSNNFSHRVTKNISYTELFNWRVFVLLRSYNYISFMITIVLTISDTVLFAIWYLKHDMIFLPAANALSG